MASKQFTDYEVLTSLTRSGYHFLVQPSIGGAYKRVTPEEVLSLIESGDIPSIIGNYQDILEVSEPSSPSSGYIRFYAKDNGLYYKDYSGEEHSLGLDSLNELQDTSFADLVSGNVIMYNGSTWVNGTVEVSENFNLTVSETGGSPSVSGVSSIVLEGATVSDNTEGQVTVSYDFQTSIESGESWPVDATSGTYFFRTDLGSMGFYNGSSWKYVDLSDYMTTSVYDSSGDGIIDTTALPSANTTNSGIVLFADDLESTPGKAVQSDDSRLSNARVPTSHDHDDRYYTESEIDILASGKADIDHTHDGIPSTTSGSVGQVWTRISEGAEWQSLTGGGDMSTSTYDIGSDGKIDVAAGGTGSDLSTTSGFLRQGSVGSVVTAGVLQESDIPDLSSLYAESSHTHNSDDIVSGVISIDRLPVASDGTSSTTDIVRSDDSRLSDSRTPGTHADSHATEGDDRITPDSIGAASADDVPTQLSDLGGILEVSQGGTGQNLGSTGGDHTVLFQTGLHNIVVREISDSDLPLTSSESGGILPTTSGVQEGRIPMVQGDGSIAYDILPYATTEVSGVVLLADHDTSVSGTVLQSTDPRISLVSSANSGILPDTSLATSGQIPVVQSGGSISYDNVPNALNRGSSFPLSPSNGDVFYRTDLRRHGYYDGTRWVSDVYDLNFVILEALPFNITSAFNYAVASHPSNALYLESLSISAAFTTTGDVSNYWQVYTYYYHINNWTVLTAWYVYPYSTIQNISRTSELSVRTTNPTNCKSFLLQVLKVGNPGAISMYGVSLRVRDILT